MSVRGSSSFGGEEGLKERQDQDKRKWMRCRQNGVKLLYWDGEKPLTEEYFLSEFFPRIMEGEGVQSMTVREETDR